jgi:predicted O-methyltransferase YrrM
MTWWHPSKPAEIAARPWLPPEATLRLEHLLQPTWRVLEHGSGGSTLWFAERVQEVFSVEADLDWWRELSKRAPANARVIFWDAPSLPIAPRPFDLLLVDGDPVINRWMYLQGAELLVRPGGWVILDNCNREEYAGERASLQGRCRSFETIQTKIGKYLNTEFYQLEGN